MGKPQKGTVLHSCLRTFWHLTRTAFDILVAPWPFFGLALLLIGVLGTLLPLVQIRATAGLIDTLTAQAGIPAADGTPLLDRLAPSIGSLLQLIGAMFVNGLINTNVLQPYLYALHGERVIEHFNRRLFQKVLRLHLERFESPAYYDMLHRFCWPMQSSAVISNRIARLQLFMTRIGDGLAILWALARVHWTLALVLLLGCLSIFRWRLHASGHLIAINYAQTPLWRRLE